MIKIKCFKAIGMPCGKIDGSNYSFNFMVIFEIIFKDGFLCIKSTKNHPENSPGGRFFYGAEGGNRTPMTLRSADFESAASASSTTSAYLFP